MNARGAAERFSGTGTAGDFLTSGIAIVFRGSALNITAGAYLIIGAGHEELNILVWSHNDSMSRLDQDGVARIRETGNLDDAFVYDHLSISARFHGDAEFGASHGDRSRR